MRKSGGDVDTGGLTVPDRSAVVLQEGDRVALIRRDHVAEAPYYLFPGGAVEQGESAEQAARREALEELGVEVELGDLLAIVMWQGRGQYYWWATRRGGVFGTGAGPEMAARRESPVGSHTPVWLPLAELACCDVRPAAVASLLAQGHRPPAPVVIVERH